MILRTKLHGKTYEFPDIRLLMGKANGLLEGNMHLKAPEGTPMANVFVSLMQGIGHPEMQRFGDSTGVFPLVAPKGV